MLNNEESVIKRKGGHVYLKSCVFVYMLYAHASCVSVFVCFYVYLSVSERVSRQKRRSSNRGISTCHLEASSDTAP